MRKSAAVLYINSSLRRSSSVQLGHNYPDFALAVDVSNSANLQVVGNFIASSSNMTSTVRVRRRSVGYLWGTASY